jgi:hypothetical protein
MRLLACILAAAMISGCATHGQVSGGTGSLGFQFNTSRAALVAVGILAIVAENERDEHFPQSNPITAFDPSSPRAVPPMDASRKVNEQDCSKPIEDWSANLRCR